MKTTILLLSMLSVHFCFAQTKVEWKEKDEFHKVMAQTFHPLEDGNYAPIKERSQEMYDKAVAWQKSAIPAGIDKKKTKKILKKLVKESKALNDKIKAGTTDEIIKADLTRLHDIFHELVGLCKH